MKKTKIIPILLALFGLMACHEDFLEDKAYSIITQDSYFKTSSDAVTAINGVYAALTSDNLYEGDLMRLNEYTSENVTTRLSVAEAYSRYDTWKFQTGDFSGIYSGSYRLIERANQVLGNIQKTDMQATLKKRIIGEASFLRALAYFNLVRIYGGVPLKLEPTLDFSKTSFPRATASEIYDQVIKDLIYARDSCGIPKTSAYATADKGRVGRSAIQTLLGKVYLTRATEGNNVAQTGDYQKAVENLNACFIENDRSLVSTYANLWSVTNENNPEIIFDIQYIRKAGLGGNLTSFLPTGVTQELFIVSYGDFPASVDFYRSFEAGDQRRSVTFHDRMKVKIGGVDTEVYFDPAGDPNVGTWKRSDNNAVVARTVVPSQVPGFRKFVDFDKANARAGQEEPNFVILRYADVLLMLAEALNEVNNGPTADAYNYLNMVRRRAFGKPVNTPDATVDYSGLDKQGFRNAIFTERRKEFVIEDHAWFDGKRFWDIFTQRVADEAVGFNPNLNVRPKAAIDVNEIRQDKYKLMPFSETQLELNKELTQNPGYN